MPNDLMPNNEALSKLYRDMETTSRLFTQSSCLDIIKQMDSIRIPLGHQLEACRSINISGATSMMKDLLHANQHWQTIYDQITATSQMVQSLSITHRSWLDQIKQTHKDLSKLDPYQVSAKLALCDISLQLIAAKHLLAGVNFGAMTSHCKMNMPLTADLEKSVTRTISSYGLLTESMRSMFDITKQPSYILPGATREILTMTFATRALFPRKESEPEETEVQFIAKAERETSNSISLLQQVDPELVRLFIGAKDALNSKNVDRTRHALISLRELWNHLLRRIAPDDLVSTWISSNANQRGLLDKNIPTRRAKVLYLCRGLNNGPCGEFLTRDTEALVCLINLFNRVHELNPNFTDEQIRALLLKTESWLTYILQIWKEFAPE